jgi:hypothetical protein
MRRAMAAVVLAAALGGCGAGESPGTTTEPTTLDTPDTTSAPMRPSSSAPATTTAKAAEPMRFEAGGETQTEPFNLTGGSYHSRFKFSGDCYYSVSLNRTDGEYVANGELGSGMGPIEGETNLYNLQTAEYFIKAITGPAPGCKWEITLTKR